LRNKDIPEKARVLFSLGGGGHLYEALWLAQNFEESSELYFITSRSSAIPKRHPVVPESCFKICDIATIAGGDKMLTKAANTLRATFQAMRVYLAVNPELVVGVGTALSVPMSLAAIMLRIRTVFVESVTGLQLPRRLDVLFPGCG
jgi:UDP-N-acetylglucosamine:LPS N-acetylglucosamine transferase